MKSSANLDNANENELVEIAEQATQYMKDWFAKCQARESGTPEYRYANEVFYFWSGVASNATRKFFEMVGEELGE